MPTHCSNRNFGIHSGFFRGLLVYAGTWKPTNTSSRGW
jgi:hypothetical protein